MTDLESAKQKLLWSLGGVWSVSISPAEAKALLDELHVEPTGTVDKRQMSLEPGPRFDSEKPRVGFLSDGDPRCVHEWGHNPHAPYSDTSKCKTCDAVWTNASIARWSSVIGTTIIPEPDMTEFQVLTRKIETGDPGDEQK